MSDGGITVGRWVVPESDLEERFDPSGGPGGQHANRSQSAVTLRLVISSSSLPEPVQSRLESKLGPVVEVTAAATRSQWRNRRVARQRMADVLESALAEPKPRRKTKLTSASRQRRLHDKRARGELKRRRRPPEPD